jgi:hypothetical protein
MKLSSWPTTGNLLNSYERENSSSTEVKKVKWNLGVRVVLIPTRNEYKDVGLADLIWWTEDDYVVFRDTAAKEVQVALEQLKLDLKEVLKTLYQPEYDSKCSGILRKSTKGQTIPHSDDNTISPKSLPVNLELPISTSYGQKNRNLVDSREPNELRKSKENISPKLLLRLTELQ